MLGFSIGPLVGGAVTHYAGWRVNFWLNVAVMIPAATTLWLNPGNAPASLLGAATGSGWACSRSSWSRSSMDCARRPPQSADPAGAIAPLSLAAIAFAALFRVETRRERPLVDFGLFRSRNFALACALAFLLMSCIMAVLLYYNLFAQSSAGLGRTPIAAGLSLMPMSAALFGFARAAPWLSAKIGLRPMMAGRVAPARARLRHCLGFRERTRASWRCCSASAPSARALASSLRVSAEDRLGGAPAE